MWRILVFLVSLGIFAMLIPSVKTLYDALANNTTGVLVGLNTTAFQDTVIAAIPILIPLAFLGGLIIWLGRKKDEEDKRGF